MRKQLSMKNFITGIIPYFILAILGFVRVDFFIDNLGDEIYAINQLFFQIFAYISLVEAGIGPLITQQYYKFFVDQDHKSINGLYTTSKKMLQKISIVILIIGFIVSFFLKFLTNNSLSLGYMQIVFMIFLFRSILEYLMLSPRLVLQADQKIYKINVLLNFYKVIEIIVEIILLQCGIDYLVILLSSIVVRFLSYYYTNRKIFREYPWLKIVKKSESVKLKDSTSVLWHKLADAIYNNTDILLISAKLEPVAVVVYSAYKYIVKFIADGVYILSNALTASFGNVVYKNKTEDGRLIFEEMNMAFFATASFFTIAIYVLSHSFVSLWLGPDKLMNNLAFIFMIIVLFNDIARRPLIICRDANGLFKETQKITIAESLLNLILSIVLISKYGLAGVLFATAFSTLVTSFWFYPQYIYRQVFKTSDKQYYLKYFICLIITLIGCFIGRHLLEIFTSTSYISWILSAIVICLLAIVLIAITFIMFFKDFRRLLYKAKLLLEEMKIMDGVKKMAKKIFNNNTILKIFMCFLIIQPVIDIYVLFKPEVADFFGFSPATIIRIIFVGILGILVLFTFKWNKKYWWFVAYGALVITYIVLHHFHALNFNSVVPGNFNYSLVSELFYFIRMIMPLFIIFVSYHLEFKDDRLNKVIFWLVWLIAGSIVITNLFGISLGSYSKVTIKGNIFAWFIDGYEKYNYLNLASKGFFNDPNRISALMALLTPLVFYCFVKKPNKSNLCLLIIQMLGMFMIGTKVATLGFIALTFLISGIYFYFTVLKRDLKWNNRTFISIIALLICSIILLPHSPAVNRTMIDDTRSDEYNSNIDGKKDEEKKLFEIVDKKILENSENIKGTSSFDMLYEESKDNSVYINENRTLKIDQEISDTLLIPFIEKNYMDFSINPEFILNSYPYQYDPYFWYQVMKQPLSQRTNFRSLEKAMLDRVKKINNNPFDRYFGITFTRMSNIFDLERDFQSHYYTLGILGLLLFLSPYLVIVILAVWMMLYFYKDRFTFRNIMFLLGICIALFAAFYSGNVMDGLVVTLILGFMVGQLAAGVFKNGKEEIESKISVIMPTYNDGDTIIETLDSIKIQSYSNWELIIVDDGSTDNTKQIIEEYCKKNNLQEQIKYCFEENSDQLNAILKGLEYITGNYVFILHSDDLLASQTVFADSIQYFNDNENVDSILGNHIIINEHGKKTGVQNVLNYHKSKKIPVIQLLWLGRNLYLDTAMHKREVFETAVKENYLMWNMPFWLSYEKMPKMLNVHKVSFSFIKYRVHSQNYINNELGMMNVINGELRTASRLLYYYDIPKYNLQYLLFRAMNRLGLFSLYYPIYLKRESQNKAAIIEFIIQKRFGENYKNNIFLNSLVNFYRINKRRQISLDLKSETIYLGSDMRKFNKQILSDSLPKMYIEIMKEMEKGFDEIIVKTEEEKEKAINLTKFLCVYPFVKVTKK